VFSKLHEDAVRDYKNMKKHGKNLIKQRKRTYHTNPHRTFKVKNCNYAR